ncbi:hypothetical protein ACRZ9O_05745 [Aquirufa sp. HETE-40SA]
MAELIGKAKSTINEYIKNVFTEGGLDEKVVVLKFRITTQICAIVGKFEEVEALEMSLIQYRINLSTYQID